MKKSNKAISYEWPTISGFLIELISYHAVLNSHCIYFCCITYGIDPPRKIDVKFKFWNFFFQIAKQ